jgi:hypothetical protein
MAPTAIQRFAAKAGLIASRYAPGEERNIIETYANNLKERLEELDKLVRNAPSFRKCKHDKTLEAFWIANVPKFITYQKSSATCEYLDTVYRGDAIFPTTNPNYVSYDCITIKLGNGGYWRVGSGMQHRDYPNPDDRTKDCPECHIPWWVGAGHMEPRKTYVEGALGEGLEELTSLFTNSVRNIVFFNGREVSRKGRLLEKNGEAVKVTHSKVSAWRTAILAG